MSARCQKAVTIEDGKTVRIEWQLAGQRKVAGVVRDERNKPMEGVKLRICPMGRQDATSDAEGRFEIGWDPRDWHGSEILIRYLVGRHEEDNLAAAVEIGEDTETLDIKLKPGVILTGKLTDPDGKGIEGAAVRVFVRGPNWDLSLICDHAKTDAEGAFEVKAIPAEHKYDVYIRAEGHGQRYVKVDTDDAVDNRLDVGVLMLAFANLSVSGAAVDSRQAKKAKAGRRGHKPYGSFEGEEKVMKRIKQLHRKPRGGKRLGPYQIAHILNRENWPTRKATQWRGSQVIAILKRLDSRTVRKRGEHS